MRARFEAGLYYVIDGDGIPRLAQSMQEYYEFMAEPERRRILFDVIQTDEGEVHVSTVFLTLDHDFYGNRANDPDYKPLIFETMIFEGKHDQYQRRYRTPRDARAGHQACILMVTGAADGWDLDGGAETEQANPDTNERPGKAGRSTAPYNRDVHS